MRAYEADPQAIMDTHAKSFAWAARFLSSDARVQAANLYAFARLMDDLVDEPALGDLSQRLFQFESHQQQVLGLSQETGRSAEVGKMLQSLQVDRLVIQSFLDALKADAQPRHLQSLPEVLSFAYGVAGTVGQMMRPILGAHPDADRHAVALGMAMQLTNIARDVLEDAARGRCYLPAQWLPSDWKLVRLLQGCPVTRGHAFAAVKRLLAEAEPLYALGAQGFAAIPVKNRRAVKIACELYRDIGRKITGMPETTYWGQRTQLGASRKLRLLLQVLIGMDRDCLPASKNTLDEYQSELQRIPGFPRVWV